MSTSSSMSSSSSSSPSKESLGQEIYSGTASFGKIWALIGAIFATIIGLLLLIGGIGILVTKSKRIKIEGQVVKIDPASGCNYNSSDNTYHCSITVSYSVDGKSYTSKPLTYSGGRAYSVGETIDVYYKKSDPVDVTLSGPIPHWVGIVAIIGGVLIPTFAWVWVWLTRKYKAAAAIAGIGGISDIIRN